MAFTVEKNGKTIHYNGNHRAWWEEHFVVCGWESQTFAVLDLFLNANNVLIDIGAWIGPIALYGAHIAKHVWSFECDPIALTDLHANVALCPTRNITVRDHALSDACGTTSFGGNGPLGNSESTLLVRNGDYAHTQCARGDPHRPAEYRNKAIITVTQETMDAVEQETDSFGGEPIGLVKMDIEGGEAIVIPTILDFLQRKRAPLYISLHWIFLTQMQVHDVVQALLSIYPYVYLYCGGSTCKFRQVDRSAAWAEIDARTVHDLIFAFDPIPAQHPILQDA